MEKHLDEFVTRGYRIVEQGQYSSKVKEKDFGSAPVHGFTFLFAFLGAAILFDAIGLPSGAVWVFAIGANVVYLAYSWLTADEVIIMVDEEAEAETEAASTARPS
jgi:hypothetical protein